MSKFFLAQDTFARILSLTEAKITICDKAFTEFLIFEIFIVTCVYIYLGLTIIFNRCKVSHVALEHKTPFPPSLKIKIFGHLAMIALLGASLTLSFSDSSYWLKGCNASAFGLLYIVHMAVLMFNIGWLKFQYERKIPLLWYQNQLFWLMISVSYLFAFVACYVINPSSRFDNPDFYFVIFKGLGAVFMTVYSVRKPQDIAAYLLDNYLRVRLIENQDQLVADADSVSDKGNSPTLLKKSSIKRLKSLQTRGSTADTTLAPALMIAVANRIQNRRNPYNKNMEIAYKIHVRWNTLDYKIHKTLNDFRQLERNMTKELGSKGIKSRALDSLYSVFSDTDAESMANVSFVVMTLQNFFTTIISTERIPNSLLDFLEIPESEHIALVNWSRRSFYLRDDLEAGQNMDDVFQLEDDEKERRYSSGSEPEQVIKNRRETVKLNQATEEDYFPYFNVSILKYKRAVNKDYIEFMINLSLMEKPEETWQIGKRYSDFVELRQSLKTALNVVPPKLPKKLIMVTEDAQLEERKKGLESWLRVVLNEKLYFVPQLFHFIGLNPSYFEWLKDEFTHTFGGFRAVIDNNQILIKNNKPYTVYHIVIEEIKDKKRNCYTLYRRYKEFHQLHQALQKRFFKSIQKLPDLPPKYTAFSNKTTVEFRQTALEKYMNQLFTYPDIGDSFAFRKFIHFRRPMDAVISETDSPAQMFDEGYEVESPDLSNIDIERSLSTARSYQVF